MLLLHTTPIMAIVIATCCFYLVMMAYIYGKKLFPRPIKEIALAPTVQTSGLLGEASTPMPAPRISTHNPSEASQPVEQDEQIDDYDDYASLEEDLLIGDDSYRTLLMEAERAVEEIQAGVSDIPRPVDRETLLSRLRLIVCNYAIFCDTTYYDAINRFVAVTVDRDCGLQLSEEELYDLWLQ